MATTTDTKKTASALNRLLRGEMSAVNAYDIAIESLDSLPCDVLRNCRDSHSQRCAIIRDRIVLLGDEPSDGTGAWGSVTSALTSTAAVLGDQRVVALLEEGEDHGNQEYAKVLDDDDIDGSTMLWIREQLYREQVRTHRLMSGFKKHSAT